MHDFQPLGAADPVFVRYNGAAVTLQDAMGDGTSAAAEYWPCFVGEAAYRSLGTALYLCTQEFLNVPAVYATAQPHRSDGLRKSRL